jgi:uncharacterized protein (TIGR02246 family)
MSEHTFQKPSRDDLRALVLRFTEAFNQDSLDAVMGYFADDAVYVTFDGDVHRGKAAVREAFEPQFRGDLGTLRFHAEDVIVDEVTGKAVVRWLCRHTIEDTGKSLSTVAKLKRAGYRSMFGPDFGWRGLDVLRFEGGLVREKYTYARSRLPLAERSPRIPRFPVE